jgi:hypothetical protein
MDLPPLRLRFTPITPVARQGLCLRVVARELAIGAGSAAGGKTTLLLAGAAQYADVPGYHGLVLRAATADLTVPGGLRDTAAAWFGPHGTGGPSTWSFPGGGKVTTASLDDLDSFRSCDFQYVALDEAQEFPDGTAYEMLLGRLRQPVDRAITAASVAAEDGTTLTDVPLRARIAYTMPWVARSDVAPGLPDPVPANLAWVIDRFINPATRSAAVWPLTYHDNPAVDSDEYERLAKLAGLPI